MSALLQVGNSGAERKRRRSTARRYEMAAIGEEAVPDQFGLLLEPIAIETPTVLDVIGIAAKRVAHEGQIEATVTLRLPDMSQPMYGC